LSWVHGRNIFCVTCIWSRLKLSDLLFELSTNCRPSYNQLLQTCVWIRLSLTIFNRLWVLKRIVLLNQKKVRKFQISSEKTTPCPSYLKSLGKQSVVLTLHCNVEYLRSICFKIFIKFLTIQKFTSERSIHFSQILIKK
jgi:hypothetical protein